MISEAVSQELNSTLHLTVYGAPIAYVNEMVIFTCVVRGSASMAWTSDEYIGTGGQELALLAAEPVGIRLSAVGNSQTVAELVSARLYNEIIIVTKLHIRIRSNFQTASVQCRNINAGTMNSTTFLLAGTFISHCFIISSTVTIVDAASVTCDSQSACPGDTVTCICTILETPPHFPG